MKRSGSSSSFSTLEIAVLVHVGFLLLASSWVFGGNIWWAITGLSIWAGAAPFLTVAALRQCGDRGHEARRRLWWLLPLGLYSAIVITSAFNPSFRPMTGEEGPVLIHFGSSHPALPNTVNPAKTLHALWFNAGVYLSAFNLLLIPASRRLLRAIFIGIALNTLLLAIFGTAQKLSNSGFYFGASHSPNPRFFASFIYNNHWGAFMILGLATAAGLLFYQVKRFQGRDLSHSPFFVLLMGVVLIAVSAPVSASRAATLMTGVVLFFVLIQGISRVTVARRASGRAAWPAITLIVVLAGLAVSSAGWLALRSITARYADTRESFASSDSLLGGRVQLYRDTWKLAKEKPVFGWGLDSYGDAFQLIRPQSLHPEDWYVRIYANAHSDWLQSLAETGFVGSALLVLMGALPLLGFSRSSLREPMVTYPLIGCGIILLYAWIEFPFGNSAVMISFWTIFFAALRTGQLTSRLVGEPRA